MALGITAPEPRHPRKKDLGREAMVRDWVRPEFKNAPALLGELL